MRALSATAAFITIVSGLLLITNRLHTLRRREAKAVTREEQASIRKNSKILRALLGFLLFTLAVAILTGVVFFIMNFVKTMPS